MIFAHLWTVENGGNISRRHLWTVSCKGKQMRSRGHSGGASRSRPFENVTRRPLGLFASQGCQASSRDLAAGARFA